MTAYYNENDKTVAAWLRELIREGLIAPGVVDDRSIKDVDPDDLEGFAQCHFFAGIGGWSLALRMAGWPDDREVWTGSCPCQPFSAAGEQKGFDDERHLWPDFATLIFERRPARVFGEQVASKIGREWLARVCDDLEALDYAVGAADLCAPGVGAPHIRQRLYWMADSNNKGLEGRAAERQRSDERTAWARSMVSGMADADGRNASEKRQQCSGEQRQQQEDDGVSGGVAYADRDGAQRDAGNNGKAFGLQEEERSEHGAVVLERGSEAGRMVDAPRQQMGFSRRPWFERGTVPCIDGKARPVEPGSFPLANGVPERVVRLRGYGNAIVPQLAAEFIEACEEALMF